MRKQLNNFAELAVAFGLNSDETPWRFGRSLYKAIDCGPWTVFLLEDEKTLYYEDDEARDLRYVAEIVGVRVGGMVEGSVVEVGPADLMFPFEADDLDEVLADINDEAAFYWNQANTREFKVTDPKGEIFWISRHDWCGWNWGGTITDGLSREVKDCVIEWAESFSNRYPVGTIRPLPCRPKWTIQELENCEIY